MPKISGKMTKEEKKRTLDERAANYNQMGHWLLGNIDLAFQDGCDCVQHLQTCKVAEAAPHAMSMEIAGLTCVAFSVVGKHEGLGHPSMRPFFVWACLMRKRRPMFLFIESAARFPREMLDIFLADLYQLVFFHHPGPCFHGFPGKRPRMYCIGFLRSKMTFVGSEREYKEIFERTLVLNGDDFFFLPDDHEEVLEEKQELARKKRVQLSDKFDPPWEELYPPGKQELIKKHKELFNQNKKSAKDVYICDLDQNIGYMSAGETFPTLVRHGTLYSLQKQRHATKSELFALMGFPLDPLCRSPYACAFHDVCKNNLSRAEAHRLVGNAMFLPTLGSMILYAMCSVEFQAARIIRPLSWWDLDAEEMDAEGDE